MQAFAGGRYQSIPKRSVIALISALAYFVIPMDASPDFITGNGLFDNMALLR